MSKRLNWIKAGSVEDFPINSGGCIEYGKDQIAIFNYDKKEWYAVQNLCPHDNRMVLSRGIIGDKNGTLMVACPMHKNNFCLKDGKHLGGTEEYQLKTYPVRVEGNEILVGI